MKQLLYVLIALGTMHLHTIHLSAADTPMHANALYTALSPKEKAVYDERIAILAKTPTCHFATPCRTTPLKRFPVELYGNHNFGTRTWGPGTLAAFKRTAMRATIANTQKIEPDMQRAYDYAHALQAIEMTGLIEKPFHTWQLADLSRVNGWLTRLQNETPGALRTEELPVRIISGLPESMVQYVNGLLAKSFHTQQDRQILERSIYVLSKPDAIEPELAEWFTQTQGRLKRVYANPISRMIHFELNVIGHLHYYLHRIRPWKQENTATACLLSNVILMQHGVEPIVYTDKSAYKKMFHTKLTDDQARQEVLGNYIERLVTAQYQQKNSAPGTSN